MCSTNKKVLFPFFLVGAFFFAQAQDNLTVYLQPQIDVNYRVSNNYKHNFSFAKRTFLYEGSNTQFTVKHLDIAHFSNLEIRDNQSIGMGIQFRFREAFIGDDSDELRLQQQYNITNQYGAFRIGNRLRSEQRITSKPTIHRFRYRFAVDFPLRGEELGVGEPYLVLSTESLLSVARAALPEYDQRVTAHLGWLLDKRTRFQIGTEYRAENYTHGTDHVFFLLTSLVLSL